MAVWQDISLQILHILSQPVIWLFTLILYVLHWVIPPFVYLAFLVQAVVAWPLRVIAHFEALWYYLFCGILVGTICGGSVYGVFQVFVLVLDLNRKPESKPIEPQGHSAASYRAARAEKKRKVVEKEERQATRVKLLASQSLIQEVVREARNRPVTQTSPITPNTGTAATRSGLFQDIILEQTDEEDDSDF